MDYSKILSVSGRHGLFKVVSQLKNAVLVESLIDKKRFPAFAHEKINSLEEIAVFTTGEDKPLKDVLKAIFEKLEGKPAIDPKAADNKALKDFFIGVIPDYDEERVYISDIKKIISWYNLLLENNLLDFPEKAEDKPEEAKTEPGTEPESSVPGSVPRKKKASSKEAVTETPAETPKPAGRKKKTKAEE